MRQPSTQQRCFLPVAVFRCVKSTPLATLYTVTVSIILDLSASTIFKYNESANSLSEQIDFVRNWTIPFALTAAGNRDVEIAIKLPFDASATVQRELEQLENLPRVKIISTDPFQYSLGHETDDLIFSIKPSHLLLPDFFSALENWSSEYLGNAPYRFTKRYSSALVDGRLRGLTLEGFDTPLSVPYVTNGQKTSKDLTLQRFTVDMDTVPLIEVRNAPVQANREEKEPSSRRILSLDAMRNILPPNFSSKLFEPKNFSIGLGSADPFDDPIIIDVNARGPFTMLLKGTINGGVFPKHSLVSFTFQDSRGEKAANIDIPGLAHSMNPNIGYFFYYLGAERGPFSFEYKVPAPDEYTCTQIKIMKWDGNRRAMTCDSLEITEL